ncbi:MAG: efflux RND transporter permease subunit [Oligoflexales bacterium]|nr:efflux RND transporter permease subunit [Oligoflexales bacterium]
MNLFKFLQNNKLFVHYMTIFIVLGGIAVMLSMQREARPNVNFNRVAVSAFYPGAAPSDMEELVVDPIEEKIAEVDGVKEYRSVSFNGAAAISVIIDQEFPEPDKAVEELRRKIGEVRDLPLSMEDPVVTEIKASNIPILRLAVYGNLKPLEFKLEIEKLKDYLKNFPGVQSVSYTGLDDLQIKVMSDPKKLDQADLTLIEVLNGVSAWAKQKPGGFLENKEFASNLSIGQDYDDLEKLKNFTIRSNDSGKSIKLSQIADLEFDTKNTQQSSLYGDKDAVLLTVVKKPNADIITTVDRLVIGLGDYSKNMPKELSYKLYRDESKTVRDRLGIVTNNAIMGLFLVVFLLVVFLDFRSALITTMGIPVAFLGGLCLIYFYGSTLNSIAILGMIIVLGMLVDDAIVVSENIFSYIEQGLPPQKAALLGVSEIAMPVIATVLTTVFAFFPILFMKDVMGQFMRVIPMTVIAMLLVSLFEALIILPIHAEEILKPIHKVKKSIFNRIEGVYQRYLIFSMRIRYLIVIGLLLFLFLSAKSANLIFQRFTLFPTTGLEGLSVRVELPLNIPLQNTNAAVKDLSKVIQDVAPADIDSLYSTIGEVTTGGNSGSRQNGTHLANINVAFTSDQSFIDRENVVLGKIRTAVAEFSTKNSLKTSITVDRPGPPVGKPIQFEIASRNLEKGAEVAKLIREQLSTIPGVHSLETDLDGNSKRFRFVVNNEGAISEGINPNDIAQTLFAATTGRVASEILKNNEKVEVLVNVNNKQENLNLEELLNLKVRNRSGQAIPIKLFTKIQHELSPSSIQRLDGLRTVTLFGEIDEKLSSGKIANDAIAPFIAEVLTKNPGVSINTGGGEKERMNALKDTLRLYILAIILIFMVISLSFQSVIYPFLVLLSVPMGVAGVVWALILHDTPLSLMGIIGLVGLSGVVVNVSILFLSYVQQKIKEGTEVREAIIAAAVRRLRPIVITTLTTLIGLAPTIYGFGGVDAFVRPLALVLGWGLLVSSVLTVFFLPATIATLPTRMLTASAKQSN